jgi:hypothetical protein
MSNGFFQSGVCIHNKRWLQINLAGIDEDNTDTIILNKKEFEQIVEILQKNSVGTIELEDQMSTILINSDIIQFNLQDHKSLEAQTFDFQKRSGIRQNSS